MAMWERESAKKFMEKSIERLLKTFVVKRGANGMNYVAKESVKAHPHATEGNEKTGKAGNWNLPIEYTCKHDCECYKNRDCYACHGCYNFNDNQAQYTENYNFYMACTDAEFIDFISWHIQSAKLTIYRYFTCGDIPDARFLPRVVAIAKKNPSVKFWFYTKKYSIVNRYLDENNGELPENLFILFSHWLNKDGTYYPMENPYNMPTSEFIPLGKEYLTETVTHICPCSNPDSIETCATCDHPCYSLRRGESMALLEHSTSETKARDKAIKAAKAAKKAAKGGRGA